MNKVDFKAADLSFKIYNNIEDIKAAWDMLANHSSDYQFYHKPVWFEAFIKNLSNPENKLLFISIHQHHELLGIIPLEYCIVKKMMFRLKVLRMPEHSHLYLYDCLIKEQLQPFILELLLDFLQYQSKFKWDVIFFSGTTENSNISKIFTHSQVENSYSVAHQASSSIQCKDNYEATVAHISSKFKRNLSRLQRKAEKLGALSYISYHYNDENNPLLFSEYYQNFLDVEHDSWKAATKTAIKCDKKLIGFYQYLAENFAPPDSCVINLLKLNDEVIAVQFGIKVGDQLNLLKIGFREQYKGIGPGNIILSYTLKDCIQKGIKKVNIVTAPPWAEKWKSHSTQLYRHFIFNSSIAGYSAKYFFLLLPFIKSTRSFYYQLRDKYFNKTNSGINK